MRSDMIGLTSLSQRLQRKAWKRRRSRAEVMERSAPLRRFRMGRQRKVANWRDREADIEEVRLTVGRWSEHFHARKIPLDWRYNGGSVALLLARSWGSSDQNCAEASVAGKQKNRQLRASVMLAHPLPLCTSSLVCPNVAHWAQWVKYALRVQAGRRRKQGLPLPLMNTRMLCKQSN